jgi:hypothetical protein
MVGDAANAAGEPLGSIERDDGRRRESKTIRETPVERIGR